MFKHSFLGVCLLLSAAFALAGERILLWPEGKIPDFQEHQIAALREDTKKPGFKIAGTFQAPPEDYAYAVRKGDKALLETLNKGLKLLMADPYWKQLKKKYDVE